MNTITLTRQTLLASIIVCSMFLATTASAQTNAQTEANVTAEGTAPRSTLFQNAVNRVNELREQVLPPVGERPEAGTVMERAMRAASTTAEAQQARMEVRTTAREERQVARTDARETRVQSREARREEIKNRISDRGYAAVENIVTRLEDAYAKLDTLLGTVEDRIEEVAATGVDTSAAVSASAEAETSLTAVQASIDAAQAAMVEASASDTPVVAMQDVRTAVQAATEAIRTAHTSIKDVVAALRSSVTVNAGASVETN